MEKVMFSQHAINEMNFDAIKHDEQQQYNNISEDFMFDKNLEYLYVVLRSNLEFQRQFFDDEEIITSIPAIQQLTQFPLNFFIDISDDNEFIIINYFQKGFCIIDIQDIEKPQVLQIMVEQSEISKNALIGKNKNEEHFIFHLTQKKLKIFKQKNHEQVKATFNLIPHVFNTHQMYKYVHQGDQKMPWRIEYHNKLDLMFLGYALDGFLIFNISSPLNPQLIKIYDEFVNIDEPYMVDALAMHPKYDDILVVGKSLDGVYTFNISDPYNPIKIGKAPIQGDTDDVLFFNLDSNFIITASGLQGCAIVNITNLTNPTVVGLSEVIDYTLEEVVLSRDDKYAFGAGRDFGIYIYNVEDKSNILLINQVQIGGGEGIKISKLQEGNILFLAANIFGLFIFDATDPYNLKLISQVFVGGATSKLNLNYDESFIIVSSNYENQVAIVNIESLENPYITQTLMEEGLSLWDAKITKDQKYLCALHDNGFYMIPISLKEAIIQEAYFKQQVINLNSPLYIGQQIDIYMYNYEQPQNKKIVQVYEYYDKQLQNLDDRDIFTQSLSQLTVNLNVVPGHRVYVFEERMKILESDFNMINGTLNKVLASQIYQDLRDSQYMDTNKLPQVQNSLNLNITSNSDIIQTFAKEVSLTIILDQNYSQFVYNDYDSVILSYSNFQSQIDISGFLQYVNQLLVQGIRYHNIHNSNENNKQQVQIVIKDDLDQQINKTYDLTNLSFLKKNKPVQLKYNLQDQVEQQHKNGDVIIGEAFDIKLSQNSFKDEDDKNLVYSLVIHSLGSKIYDLEVTQLTQFDYFSINFIKSSLRIEINSDPAIYKKNMVLILEASDAQKQKTTSLSHTLDFFFEPSDRSKIDKQGLELCLQQIIGDQIQQKDIQQDNFLFDMISMKLYYNQLRLNKNAHQIYKSLKKIAIKNGYYKKDWFMYYVKIECKFEVTSTQPFPICSIILQKFYESLIDCTKEFKSFNLDYYIQNDPDQNPDFSLKNEIEKSVNKMITQSELKKSNSITFFTLYNSMKLHLIKQALISRTLGVKYQKFLQYSSGITINARQQNIHKVQTYQQREQNSKIFSKFLKFFNMDWQQLPMSQNQLLGEYFISKCHRDILEIERIKPFRKEDTHFKLRIYSKFGYILQEFIIQQDNDAVDSDILSMASKHLKENNMYSSRQQVSENYREVMTNLISKRETVDQMDDKIGNQGIK
ncbi:hypothetical protein PPERSA_10270 [Pseudocohnilembus persalinus]|uniref:Uncharacterized protein n=1 Tax=Pseudocohnilembus persalinus TaxID=266149 RepID=A0A0V0R0Q2_PSEPJ|nr:hypothetical protein PPERSA_10270 [Pseudocohnilembus persalinus]|eukprot:KRX07882.1 hypothetical protein PPERSA_10270 [Pseudocohnilembus persalinus]